MQHTIVRKVKHYPPEDADHHANRLTFQVTADLNDCRESLALARRQCESLMTSGELSLSLLDVVGEVEALVAESASILTALAAMIEPCDVEA